MKDENSLYWIWLAEVCGPASKDFGKLAERYEDPFELYRLTEEEIEQLEGIGKALKLRLCDKSLETAYSVLRYCKSNQVSVVGYGDPAYPARLRTLEDPPVLLYVLGELPNMNNRLCIGIVGTRKMSEYGCQSAYKISYELSAAGSVIVSGMALGVDGVAACGALAAGGQTVAVLGCGISVTYPKEHGRLMREIAKHGAVITEYPPYARPIGHHFPKRNRIISGLCQGVLVVEGSEGSGALITARTAIVQGRELFALPGKIDESNAEGPNELIQNGAYAALSAEDMLRHYDFLYHDMIRYKAWNRAKERMPAVHRVLKHYGVSVSLLTESAMQVGPVLAETAPVTEQAQKEPASISKKQTVSRTPKKEPDPEPIQEASRSSSPELLATLTAAERSVWEHMPPDRPISPDGIAADGLGIGELITALTMLEMKGLAESVPGGMYRRK